MFCMIEMKQRGSGFVPPSLFKRKAEMNSHLNDSTENILLPKLHPLCLQLCNEPYLTQGGHIVPPLLVPGYAQIGWVKYG